MINSLVKAIRILHSFSETEPRLSLAEISGRLDIPKSTVHNLLATLLAQGFIEKVEGDRYALGVAPLVLTQNMRVNVEIRDPAAPFLRELADATNESAYLTVMDGDYALYIYAVESPRRLLARTAVGDHAHLHCTSVGKAILACLDDAEVEAIVRRTGLPAYTQATHAQLHNLLADLRQIRARGYAVDCGEHEDGTYCIGAPVLGSRGRVLGACSISGTDPEIVGTHEPGLATAVVRTAQRISRHTGYVPSSPGLMHWAPNDAMV